MPRTAANSVVTSSPSDADSQDRPVSSLGEMVRGRLPRGATSLPKEVVEKEQRNRLVLGMANVVARKGYAKTTLTDIISASGVSRSTFYELFRDKEECFLFGYSMLDASVQADLVRARDPSKPLTEQMFIGLDCYCRRINVDVQLAKAFIGEAQAATPKTRAVYDENVRKGQINFRYWIEAMRTQYPAVPRVSDAEIAMVMHGMNNFIISHIREGLVFTENDTLAIYRFVLAGLGMSGHVPMRQDSAGAG